MIILFLFFDLFEIILVLEYVFIFLFTYLMNYFDGKSYILHFFEIYLRRTQAFGIYVALNTLFIMTMMHIFALTSMKSPTAVWEMLT